MMVRWQYIHEMSNFSLSCIFSESAILIATRSSFVPSGRIRSSANSEELNMSLGIPGVAGQASEIDDWESWRDENTLEISEASISIRNNHLRALLTR